MYINGDGETSLDFCYIDKLVQMNFLAATTDSENDLDQVYNVALYDRTNLIQLYDMNQQHLIQMQLDLAKKAPIHRDFRVGDERHSQADISKAQNLLGYQPSHRINESLDEAMAWNVGALLK